MSQLAGFIKLQSNIDQGNASILTAETAKSCICFVGVQSNEELNNRSESENKKKEYECRGCPTVAAPNRIHADYLRWKLNNQFEVLHWQREALQVSGKVTN